MSRGDKEPGVLLGETELEGRCLTTDQQYHQQNIQGHEKTLFTPKDGHRLRILADS